MAPLAYSSREREQQVNTQNKLTVLTDFEECAPAEDVYLADCASLVRNAGTDGCFTRLHGSPEAWDCAADRPVLVLYERAETAVSTGLARGLSPAQALKNWEDQAQELLAFCRRNRRQVALLEAENLINAPETMLERACGHLGIASLPEPDLERPAEPAGPVWEGIAALAVARSAAAAALNAELEARAIPADAAQPEALEIAERAAQDYRRQLNGLAEQEVLKTAFDAAQKEIQTLGRERPAQKTALDAQTHLAALKQSQAELLQVQLRSLQDALEAERRDFQGVLEEKRRNAANLVKVQGALEETRAALKKESEVRKRRGRIVGELSEQVAALEAAQSERDGWLTDKDAQLQAVWNSTSWRMTAPLRWVKLAVNGQLHTVHKQPGPEEAQPGGAGEENVLEAPEINAPAGSAGPKVSVVTVVYCDADGLENTLGSVRRQSYPNIEYVVVDGASPDRTREILDAQAGSIDVLISEPDKGIYDAMNKGIAAASGDYIIFMNAADTFAHDNTLEEVAAELTGEDVVYGHRYYMRKSGPVLQASHPADYVRQRMPYCHQSAYYRREVLQQHPFNLAYKYAADYNQVVEMFVAGCSFKQIDKALCNFEPGGASESGIRPYLEVLKIQFDNFGDGDHMKESEYMQGFVANAPNLLKNYQNERG